ncbi:MAG: hypothetical protein KDD10_27960 [Phaeodactylibacter sp.]|nr:hypothetical protein [Phaeodactylibacter sp.]MCB9267791.1 hypothetical protein [Lewinellaceae bacterium]
MRNIAFILLGSLIFSCTAPKQTPASKAPAPPSKVESRAAAQPYTCMGNEPFWSVQVKGNEIVFRTPEEGPVSYPYQAPQQRNGHKVFSSKTGGSNIEVVIREQGCTDTMSGEKFPYTVEVTRDGKKYRGCGK